MRRLEPCWQPLEAEIEAAVEQEGCELVVMEVLGHPGQHLLRLRIDRPGGVSVRDCERVSHHLNALLDVLNPFPGAYRLEVSSPGVERPLTRLRDFERFAGQPVRVAFLEDGSRKRAVSGTLRGCRGEAVLVEVGEAVLEIPYRHLREAHLTYDWDAEAEPPT